MYKLFFVRSKVLPIKEAEDQAYGILSVQKNTSQFHKIYPTNAYIFIIIEKERKKKVVDFHFEWYIVVGL